MPIEDFLSLRTIVFQDAALQETLRAAPTDDALHQAVLALAAARDLALTADDLRAIVAANRRGWLERWLYQ